MNVFGAGIHTQTHTHTHTQTHTHTHIDTDTDTQTHRHRVTSQIKSNFKKPVMHQPLAGTCLV